MRCGRAKSPDRDLQFLCEVLTVLHERSGYPVQVLGDVDARLAVLEGQVLGTNVGLGRDYTIYAMIAGKVAEVIQDFVGHLHIDQ